MRITLAYRWQDHRPGETVEVDDTLGRRLITTGWARPADHAPTEHTSEGEESNG